MRLIYVFVRCVFAKSSRGPGSRQRIYVQQSDHSSGSFVVFQVIKYQRSARVKGNVILIPVNMLPRMPSRCGQAVVVGLKAAKEESCARMDRTLRSDVCRYNL